ncbi:Bowman-Birk type wound-induced proteinase inhibitor WIP1-like [Lolium rigidum]|uniref:Bowman-Birk type wound-induced proteinase inhibitor WIP1-like n=1 Tax=Lolium rigidum TaxID=89674 RepID=UPI001F5DE190|nr:Bowman-Birk type wound-induced proteinase inhibitor WIP1-like [Lolium rigidum]
MKISSTLVIILLFQAALATVIFADVHATSVGEGKAVNINPGKLKCCSNCNFSFSGLYTCDDLVIKECDPICKSCDVVKTSPVKEYKCADTFLGICDPPCK